MQYCSSVLVVTSLSCFSLRKRERRYEKAGRLLSVFTIIINPLLLYRFIFSPQKMLIIYVPNLKRHADLNELVSHAF